MVISNMILPIFEWIGLIPMYNDNNNDTHENYKTKMNNGNYDHKMWNLLIKILYDLIRIHALNQKKT